MDQQRRNQIERRWQEIYRKIAEAERTGETATGEDRSKMPGVRRDRIIRHGK